MNDRERLCYLAGIIDGEGSIELRLNRGISLNLVLHVFNSDKPLMEWIQLYFGGKVYDIHRRARLERPQWQPVYNWNLTSTAARDLLEALAPFMVIKRAQAEHAVEAWAERGDFRGSGRWHGMPEGVVEMRKVAVDQMHQLNRKNRGA